MRKDALIAAAATVAVLTGGSSAGAAAGRPDIDHPGFASSSGLVLNGDAAVTGGVLRLTGGRADQVAAVWSTTTIDPRRPFDTAFDVATSGPAVHADGFAFVVQSDGSRALGGLGGSIGYGGLTRSVAVEFDTYRNSGEPDGNHVAVVTRGRADAPQTDAATSPFPLFGGRLRVRVAYDPRPDALTIGVKRAGEPWTRAITKRVDLARVLGTGPAYVGFTAATGRSVSTQDVESWRLTQP